MKGGGGVKKREREERRRGRIKGRGQGGKKEREREYMYCTIQKICKKSIIFVSKNVKLPYINFTLQKYGTCTYM